VSLLKKWRKSLGKCLCLTHMSRHDIDIYTHIHRQQGKCLDTT
jgi:hypothetical protein